MARTRRCQGRNASQPKNPSGKNQHPPPPPDEVIRPWVESYSSLNIADTEIVVLLRKHYDTTQYQFGVKTLKRRRAAWGLPSTRQQGHTAESIAPMVAEIRERYPKRGAEGIRRTLLTDYGQKVSRQAFIYFLLFKLCPNFVTSRKLISDYLLATEPKEVEKRRGVRLGKRKTYYAAGVNEHWCMDQHDKWGYKFGLWLHACMDPYTSWIVWLFIWWTNSNPRLIAHHYFKACRKTEGSPLVTQSDPGSENNIVANVHTIIRHTLDSSLSDTRQHRIMKKHNNVKSEGLWSIFRRDFAPGFEKIFDWGVNHGLYDVDDPLERLVFRWLAIPWMQAEINNWVHLRNHTAPRHDKNKILPQGIPVIIRLHPEKYGGCDFKIGVPDSLYNQLEAEHAPPDHPVFQLSPPAFDTRANKLYEQMGKPPVSSSSFWSVYQGLLKAFKTSTIEDTEEFTNVLSSLDEVTRRISEVEKNEISLIPGLKPLRAGGTIVGDGEEVSDEDLLDGSLVADLTDSEEEEEGEAMDNGPPTFMASMTPTVEVEASASST